MQLDDQLKQLLRELGQSINESISESDKISGAIANLRAAGYDIMLKLDATIGLARRDPVSPRISRQDRRFLESLHIRVDEELTPEEVVTEKLTVTPQDLRFLKSLKISIDERL